MRNPTQHLLAEQPHVIGVHKILPLTNPFPSVLQNPDCLIHLIWSAVVISTLNADKDRVITCHLILNNMADHYDGGDTLSGLIIISVGPG